MAKYLSDRQQSLRVGISSYTETKTVLQTIGKVGIGTTNATQSLDVNGSVKISGVVTATTFSASNIFGSALSISSGISTLGVTTTTSLTAQQLNVSGVSTFTQISVGSTTGQNQYVLSSTGIGLSWQSVSAVGGNAITISDDTSTSTPKYLLFTGSTSGNVSTENVSSTKLTYIPLSGSLGIGTTNPTSKLHVVGDALLTGISTLASVKIYSSGTTGIVTSANPGVTTVFYYGDGSNLSNISVSSIVGVTTYATNAGIATNLGGGATGLVPYQSNTGITTFVANPGTSGKVLLFNGTVPIWSDVSAANGAFGGISVRDENNNVGTSGSITILNFVGSNISVIAATGANGIATITVADNLVGTALSISGISTFTNGPVIIGAATSTGTASQRLQVTGGAYVSSNVGVAVTAPSFAVDVSGDSRVQSTGKMRFGGTAGTTNFYIQYNSTTNSLDFVAG